MMVKPIILCFARGCVEFALWKPMTGVCRLNGWYREQYVSKIVIIHLRANVDVERSSVASIDAAMRALDEHYPAAAASVRRHVRRIVVSELGRAPCGIYPAIGYCAFNWDAICSNAQHPTHHIAQWLVRSAYLIRLYRRGFPVLRLSEDEMRSLMVNVSKRVVRRLAGLRTGV